MPVRVLVFSSLFPSEARPRHGIMVETRLRNLLRDCPVDARVIAPVPWFPSTDRLFGAYADMAATPRHATREYGVQVSYPRYLMIPRLGLRLQPQSIARAALGDIAALARSGWIPDIIDAHYFYPDGVAAALLAERLRIPFVITARGTDINVLGQMAATAGRIVRAAQSAAEVVAVSPRLKESLMALGVESSKISVLRNGVDLDVFAPEDRARSRQRFGLPDAGRVAACVGNLLPEKGHALAIESLAHLGDLQLLLVGDGPTRGALEALARRLGVEARVRFIPTLPQNELRHVYSSIDVLLLPSLREGWPSVVLESMACGTPVVATDVGAVGEMVTDPKVGRVVQGRAAPDFAAAVTEVLLTRTPPEEVRRHAAQFDWGTISRAQLAIFSRVLGHPSPSRPNAMTALPCV